MFEFGVLLLHFIYINMSLSTQKDKKKDEFDQDKSGICYTKVLYSYTT